MKKQTTQKQRMLGWLLAAVMLLGTALVPGTSFGAVPQAPDAPTVTAETTGKNQITVSWTPNGAAADYYEITGNGSVTTQTALSKDFTGLALGTEYSFSVKGHNEAGYGAAGTASAKTWRTPSEPRGMAGEATAPGEITYTWTEPESDGGTPLIGYGLTVYEAGGSPIEGSPFFIENGTTSKKVGGLTAGRFYVGYVVAENSLGKGLPSTVSLGIEAESAVDAGTPVFTDNLDGAVNATYGDALTLTVKAEINEKWEARKGKYSLNYQWFEAPTSDGSNGEPIKGATGASCTVNMTKMEPRYFYCEAINQNDLTNIKTGLRGENTAKANSAVTTVTIGKRALNSLGIEVKKTASIYNGEAITLGTLMTLETSAGALQGETLQQVLDLADANLGNVVEFSTIKTTTAVNAADGTVQTTTAKAIVPYEDVAKNNGIYTYEVTIPQNGSSGSYALSDSITGAGILTVVKKKHSGGGGGGSSGSSTTTASGLDVKVEEEEPEGQGETAGDFLDISKGDWFYQAVMDLSAKGIVSGIADMDAQGKPVGTYTFRPAANVTRAEFVTMLAKTAGADLGAGQKVFSDVNADSWYGGAVAWAAEAGVASGTGSGSFLPNANIARQDMAVMINKYLTNVEKKTLPAKSETLTFTDASQIAGYAAEAVEAMQIAGIISGIPNQEAGMKLTGTYQFAPKANASRAEAASMLHALLGAMQ